MIRIIPLCILWKFKVSKFAHITPQLKKFHWLPVRYRVPFKIGLITYKIIYQGQPVSLRELNHPHASYTFNCHHQSVLFC